MRKSKPNVGCLTLNRGRYYYKVRLPGTERRTSYSLIAPGQDKGTRDKRLAISLANDMYKEAQRRVDDPEAPPAQMPLYQYVDMFVRMRQSDVASKTMAAYKDTIKYLLGFFDNVYPLNAVTPMQAQEFKSALAQGKLAHLMTGKKKLNPVSVNSHMTRARAVFSFAVKKLRVLSENPFSGTVDTITRSKRWYYVAPDELNALLEAATDNYRSMIALCRLAGLRRLEALNVRWIDIDFEKNRLRVIGDADWQPKNRKTRYIPICLELRNILLDAYNRDKNKAGLICSPKEEDSLYRDIKATILRAGLIVWAKPFHTMRKNCITDWVVAGNPIHAVKEWAGHADIKTTQKYYLQVSEAVYDQAAGKSLWNISKKKKEENPHRVA
jgi:integrase